MTLNMNDARTNEMMMIMTRFATHFHPERVIVNVTYDDDDEIIVVRVTRDDERVITYTFEISSDDYDYVFVPDDASQTIMFAVERDD